MKSGIIYKGPSLLDGKPIVVIATLSNRNSKTGNVVQTYILKSDTNPLEARQAPTRPSAAAASCEAHQPPTQNVKSLKIGHATLTSVKVS